MKITVKRQGDLLAPCDEDGLEFIRTLKHNEPILGTFKRKRNLKYHNKYFKLLRTVVKNSEAYNTVEQLYPAILIAIGHAEIIIMPEGDVHYKPKSISFEEVDQDSFVKIFNDTVNVILQRFLPNWEDEDMQKVLDDIVRF